MAVYSTPSNAVVVSPYPTLPRLRVLHSLQPRCVSALRRIFTLSDHDMDGVLNDEELKAFQVACFKIPMKPGELAGVKKVVQENSPEGINDNGLNVEGFIYLHALCVENGRSDTVWTVLRKYGYGDAMCLRKDLVAVPFNVAPDQSVELTTEAVEFLRGIFRRHDTDNDGALQPNELAALFSTAPECPWREPHHQGAAEKTISGDLTLNGFLSEKTGKSAIINSFIGRPFSETDTTTTGERWAVNVVDEVVGSKKTLILREIPEDETKFFLSRNNSLAACDRCDVAVFVYDSSDEYSWKSAKELLGEVANKGDESEHYLVPCLLIAAKDDLNPHPMAVQDSLELDNSISATYN